jgi:hypothetical protein
MTVPYYRTPLWDTYAALPQGHSVTPDALTTSGQKRSP